MKPNPPKLMQAAGDEHIAQLQVDAIRSVSDRLGRPLSIVEAGCGQAWLIDLKGIDYTLTGVDLDAAALELRKSVQQDLDTVICGDLCTLELPEASFDVVYSFYVLEHVPQAELALLNLIRWLKPGGLMILRLPDPRSVRGFYSKITPHWVHILYYRFVYQKKMAGKPGHPPYPISYHPIIERESLCGFLEQHGMTCVGCYGDGYRREGSKGWVTAILNGINKLTALLSLGKLHAEYSDILYIVTKPSQQKALES